jgi:hypothetical protein
VELCKALAGLEGFQKAMPGANKQWGKTAVRQQGS